MSDVFKALADSTRRELFLKIAETPSSVNDLAKGFSMSRPAISRHLKLLHEAQLITFDPGSKDGRQRICRAEFATLKELDDYLNQVRQFWNRRLNSLGDLLDSSE